MGGGGVAGILAASGPAPIVAYEKGSLKITMELSKPSPLDPSVTKITCRFNNASPMRRMGEPEEIGRAIAWLCADDSSFVNGQGLALDGGLTAW
jgi:NAD(P)-dependent dehydrogenase (short-subunit alcohol dehydrogenase family)